MKQQPGILRTVALESPGGTYDEPFLANYFINSLKPELLRITGVGNVQVFGAPYSLRIWLKPELMAQYKVVPSDISAMLKEQNIEASVGGIGRKLQKCISIYIALYGTKDRSSAV